MARYARHFLSVTASTIQRSTCHAEVPRLRDEGGTLSCHAIASRLAVASCEGWLASAEALYERRIKREANLAVRGIARSNASRQDVRQDEVGTIQCYLAFFKRSRISVIASTISLNGGWPLE